MKILDRFSSIAHEQNRFQKIITRCLGKSTKRLKKSVRLRVPSGPGCIRMRVSDRWYTLFKSIFRTAQFRAQWFDSPSRGLALSRIFRSSSCSRQELLTQYVFSLYRLSHGSFQLWLQWIWLNAVILSDTLLYVSSIGVAIKALTSLERLVVWNWNELRTSRSILFLFFFLSLSPSVWLSAACESPLPTYVFLFLIRS